METRTSQPNLREAFGQLFLKGFPLRPAWRQPGAVAAAWREVGGLRILRRHPWRVRGFWEEEEDRARAGAGVSDSGAKLDQGLSVQVALGQGERKTFAIVR